MIKPFQPRFLSPNKESRRLALLLALHHRPESSQHHLAQLTFMSSSMVNNYIKLFKAENLIRVLGKTNRTQSYHLTSKGQNILRESLLAYSAEIVQLYGAVKREIAKILEAFRKEGIRIVALFGAAETAEVVYAAIKQTPLALVGIVDSDPQKQGRQFFDHLIQAPQVLSDLAPDAVIITSFARQEEIYHYVRSLVGDTMRIKKLSDLQEFG